MYKQDEALNNPPELMCCKSNQPTNSVSERGRCANKTVERKAPKRCTFSPDDPKTSTELKLLGGNKNG